ncbi:ATP phosphoribosyltransferase regulatory subunit [Bacillus aquiflavi]|uniref:ATP phosphoribosyltransferase regulatory subunit n=1 Tax=Bacillus aquiflavi TaxID=2672567 RepID=A0A6B3VUX7_9BACI|nr:ATP phosphoribosyltransferase regulatory subunit [Bacillus aquiflavi]MBA4537562.1 ATP phosphoribosyltransferase regulatory subunit [Bacillus aquiflavi]NEY81819.1 ATP phosphoribosyltransferase regulatory subunit [Bacillus aquiflavi]
MAKLFMFEKPLGMRDMLPHLYERKNTVRLLMEEEIKKWGYQFIQTPMLEYYETVGSASAILDQQLFKLLDQQGHTLVLRPDMTAPIARVAASRLLHKGLPQRLAYSGSVFRAQQREGGRPAEFEQIGVECIGDETISADGEMIALMISTLQTAGLSNFRISIGHIGFVNELFTQILGTEERAETLRRFLYEKNYVGYREHVKSLLLSSIDKQRLLRLLDLQGGQETIIEAYNIIENERGKESLEQLTELWNVMKDYDMTENIHFDLSLISHMNYYTSVLFEVYAGNVGFPIGNGGRYDCLLKKFGKETVATGFALRIDRILEALGEWRKDSPVHCILFSDERRKEAFNKAAKERENGKRIVLQNINGVKNIDDCTNEFSDVSFLIGKGEKEQR